MLKKDSLSSEAVKTLYRNYFGLLSNYVKLNQGSAQDAEDIFQEVIISFIEIVRQDKFRGESAIKTFLYSLNRFSWLNELRKRNTTLAREDKYGNASAGFEPDVSHLMVNREAKKLVTDTIETLGETCKKILLAFYYENLTMKEILKLVRFESEQVLRNKKYKCMKSLEELFAKDPALAKQFKAALSYE